MPSNLLWSGSVIVCELLVQGKTSCHWLIYIRACQYDWSTCFIVTVQYACVVSSFKHMLSLNIKIVLHVVTYFWKCKQINPYCPFEDIKFVQLPWFTPHCCLIHISAKDTAFSFKSNTYRHHSTLCINIYIINLLTERTQTIV